jgi:predicted transposase YdaD
VMASLGPAAQQELKNMDLSKYEFQSDFAKHYIGIGRAEGKAEGEAKGKAEGRVALLLKLLAEKGLGPLDADTLERIEQGTLEQLETWAVRVLRATSLADVFDG